MSKGQSGSVLREAFDAPFSTSADACLTGATIGAPLGKQADLRYTSHATIQTNT